MLPLQHVTGSRATSMPRSSGYAGKWRAAWTTSGSRHCGALFGARCASSDLIFGGALHRGARYALRDIIRFPTNRPSADRRVIGHPTE